MIKCENVTLKYGKYEALTDINLQIKENVICGLWGRNGAGKTSLLSAIAGYRRVNKGKVTINGMDVFDNPKTAPQISFIAAPKVEEYSDHTTKGIFALNAKFRPNWDNDYAVKLIEMFGLPAKRKINKLSTGQNAAFKIIAAMAARTPITIFDEAYLGLDAAIRKLFFTELLEDYMRRPRTILFSTHYISEVANLFSEMVILHEGRLLLHQECDTLQAQSMIITGEAAVADSFANGKRILNTRTLGAQKEISLCGKITAADREAAIAAGLKVSPLPMQDFFIYLTEQGGAENVR